MRALERILCPIDFDEHSGRAVARARGLAARHGAELRLLHVLPLRAEPILMPRPSAAGAWKGWGASTYPPAVCRRGRAAGPPGPAGGG